MTDDPPRYRPWLTIPAADYEGHMSDPRVGQLAALSDALAALCARSRPRRLLVLGCATGNGLERVDSAVTERVVGLDVNPRYLEIARERFAGSCPGLELVCADAERHEFEAGSFDGIFAGLIFEYVEPPVLLARIARWLAGDGECCAVIQLPDERRRPVTETGYGSLHALAPVMRLLTPAELERLAADAGLVPIEQQEIALPGGKRLQSMFLRRSS